MAHKVFEPSIRARLGTAAHFCEVAPSTLEQAMLGRSIVSRDMLEKMAKESADQVNLITSN